MSKINREQFEAWGMSDTDLRITLECETYAGIAWLAWQAATNEAEAQLTALTSQLESVVAENAGLREYRPQPSGAAMMEALDAFYEYHEDVPEQGMMAAFEILCCKRPETPATDAFLAEVRASGVEMYADNLDSSADDAERDGFDDAVKFLRSEASGVRLFAAQLRQGGAV